MLDDVEVSGDVELAKCLVKLADVVDGETSSSRACRLIGELAGVHTGDVGVTVRHLHLDFDSIHSLLGGAPLAAEGAELRHLLFDELHVADDVFKLVDRDLHDCTFRSAGVFSLPVR